MSRQRLAALAGSVVLCASGCAAPWGDGSTAEPAGSRSRADAGPSPAVPSPAAASAQLRQFRRDLTRRVLQVTVTARVPLRVTGVGLTVPGFDPLPVTAVDVALPAGATVDLPVAYGPVRCSEAPDAATATLGTAEGAAVRLELEDRGLVERLHTAQCADEQLARQVALSVDGTWTEVQRDGRPLLQGSLVLARQEQDQRVTVTDLGAHIVLTVRPQQPADLPLALAPDDTTARLPLELVASRCDPHALAENKRMGLLSAYVAVGDRPARRVTVSPDEASRTRIADFAVRSCRS